MSDELKNALAGALNFSIEALKDTKDFLAAEIPDVAKQFLTWVVVKGIISGFIWFIIFISTFIYTRKFLKSIPEKGKVSWSYDNTGVIGAPLVIPTIALVISWMLTVFSLGLISDLFNGIYALVAPKAYLLQYLMETVKK